MRDPRNPVRPGTLPRWALAGIVLFAGLMISRAWADEIRFKTRDGAQTGTVLEEDGGTITVRFPREAIESITRATGSRESEPKQESVPGLEERVRELEKKVGSLPTAGSPSPGGEGAGGVEGVIRWKDRPLSRGRVMIVPAKYAGLSPPPPERGGPGGVESGDRYETETDADGRYRFERVPPGEYLLYWMPDGETGWVRRLRERPDIDVVPGGMTVLNIPEKRK